LPDRDLRVKTPGTALCCKAELERVNSAGTVAQVPPRVLLL
jgi:hypothetical protein